MFWVGDSLEKLRGFPEEVRQAIGYALHAAQQGETTPQTKLLRGMSGGVYEIVDDFDTNTYRAVYVAKLASGLYVLHCFQKKSKTGIKTPKSDLEMIKSRLKLAKEQDKESMP